MPKVAPWMVLAPLVMSARLKRVTERPELPLLLKLESTLIQMYLPLIARSG